MVSDIGIIILLALVVFFGRRRSWFVSRDFLATYVGVVQRARERLEEQTYGHNPDAQDPFLRPDGHVSTKEESQMDVMSDRSQNTGTLNIGGRDMKVAQLE